MEQQADHDPRRSCYRKHAYSSQIDAEKVAARLMEKRGQHIDGQLRAYACNFCGSWHLTSDAPWRDDGMTREARRTIHRQVYERDGGICRVCSRFDGQLGEDGEFVELLVHVIERERAQDAGDFVLLCRPCHTTAIDVVMGRADLPDRSPDALRALAQTRPGGAP